MGVNFHKLCRPYSNKRRYTFEECAEFRRSFVVRRAKKVIAMTKKKNKKNRYFPVITVIYVNRGICKGPCSGMKAMQRLRCQVRGGSFDITDEKLMLGLR